MITVVNSEPIAFERIVVEDLAAPLGDHGFRKEPTFPLYEGQMVVFARQREGQREAIELQRSMYDRGFLKGDEFDDEVEATPINYGGEQFGFEQYWVSRHRIHVYFVADGATNWLQRNGKAGTGEADWWRFADEQDLRRLLRELLPLILDAGMRRFDDRLEDNRMWAAAKRPATVQK